MFSIGNQLLGCIDIVVGTLDFKPEGRWFEVQSLPLCCFLRQETLPHFVSLHPVAEMGSQQHYKRSWWLPAFFQPFLLLQQNYPEFNKEKKIAFTAALFIIDCNTVYTVFSNYLELAYLELCSISN